jgi:transcriptional regulator with XRE-family HTH domain
MAKQNEVPSFGQTLQKIRRSKDKSQRDVANAIGMDFSYFSRLENDRFDSKPTRETIDKIATAMECTSEERGELLAAAGRIDEEMEKAAKHAQASGDPNLSNLFRSLPQLSSGKLEELWQQVQSELETKPTPKPKKK